MDENVFMKYDPIELMKLNITEASIQRVRDSVLSALTEHQTKYVVAIYPKIYLPFIIDMLDGHKFECEPLGYHVTITITLP